MMGSAAILTLNMTSMLLMGSSMFAVTSVSTTMRPEANETSSGPRVHLYGRSPPSNANVPSPVLGTASSRDERSPAPDSDTCALILDGEGSATSGLGRAAGRDGYTGPNRVQPSTASKGSSQRVTT